MENRDAQLYAADVVDRLWRAYLPFRRGRSIFGDLPRMLAILVLARFVETTGTRGASWSGGGSEPSQRRALAPRRWSTCARRCRTPA